MSGSTMIGTNIEISVGGHSLKVPALDIDGHPVVVTGGWVKVAAIHDENWIEGGLQDLESFVRRLRQHNTKSLRADIFIFGQQLPDITPRYSYRMEWESVAAIRLSSYEAWWTERIAGNVRSDVRRSTKRGVIVKETEFDDEFVRGIVEIYNESPIRQGRAFWHYRKDFDTVKRENATYLERSVFLGAYYQNELIGFAKIVRVGKVGDLMQIISKMSHYDKRPANALIAKAVEYCADNGVSYLTYGTYRNRNRGMSSLTRFKHRVGFEEVRTPRFYVPLTTKGRIWLALGLHRDLAARLPEWAMGLLYRVRTRCDRLRARAHRDSDQVREG